MAYDFQSGKGLVGRQFMNEIQNVSAYIPYMVCHGNHESAYLFAHYTGEPECLLTLLLLL